jgi:hypothetical protein
MFNVPAIVFLILFSRYNGSGNDGKKKNKAVIGKLILHL